MSELFILCLYKQRPNKLNKIYKGNGCSMGFNGKFCPSKPLPKAPICSGEAGWDHYHNH